MEDRKIIIEKKIECIIGIFFLIPPVFGVLGFIFSFFGADADWAQLYNLDGGWSAIINWSHSDGGGGGGMSAAPIYLAIMAFVGAYLIKDKLRYLIPDKKEEKPTQETTNE